MARPASMRYRRLGMSIRHRREERSMWAHGCEAAAVAEHLACVRMRGSVLCPISDAHVVSK
jgi:hypothetical protein